MSTNKRSDIVGFHNIKNKVTRNAFDLSHRHMFTAQIGQLLPIFTQWVNPNETFKIGYNGFARTASLQTAAFTRLRENVQFYFVPFSSLWCYFEQQVNNMTSGQSGENISKIAASFTSPSSITTGMPYINYAWFKNYICEILDLEMQAVCAALTSKDISVSDVVDAICPVDSFGAPSDKFMSNGVFRHSSCCKLLRSLGYGNFPLEFYDPISCAMSYASENNSYPPAWRQVKDSNKYGYTSFSNYVNIENSPNLSIFPLLAYHKICQDHYKYRQWQAFDPTLCNIDYLKPADSMNFTAKLANDWTKMSDFLCLEQSNLPLDYFNGVLPRAQYGDESAVSVSNVTIGNDNITLSNPVFYPANNAASSPVSTNAILAYDSSVNSSTREANLYQGSKDSQHLIHQITADVDLTSSSETASFKVSALRSAIALQKYKEIQESNDSDFASQVLAHFGVKPNSSSRISRFIGGADSTISINPEINQNLADGNTPEIKATGTSQLSAGCKFTSDTYGIIIGIYRCIPQLDFAKVGIDRQLIKTDASDFPIPELDNIGMQTQYRFEVVAPSDATPRSQADMSAGLFATIDMSRTYGYTPRYAEYKTSFDRYEGAFLDSLSSWVTGYDVSALKQFMYRSYNNEVVYPEISSFLVCHPKITYPIWLNQYSGTSNDDKILVGSVVTCVAVRPFSVYGLPYTK